MIAVITKSTENFDRFVRYISKEDREMYFHLTEDSLRGRYISGIVRLNDWERVRNAHGLYFEAKSRM